MIEPHTRMANKSEDFLQATAEEIDMEQKVELAKAKQFQPGSSALGGEEDVRITAYI